VKQTKTTLILGVLLAVIVIVLVTFEIKNNIESQEGTKIENATVFPSAKKIKNTVLPIIKTIGKTVLVEAGILKK